MNVHVYMYNTEGESHKHSDILCGNVKLAVQPINGPLLYTVHVTQYENTIANQHLFLCYHKIPTWGTVYCIMYIDGMTEVRNYNNSSDISAVIIVSVGLAQAHPNNTIVLNSGLQYRYGTSQLT